MGNKSHGNHREGQCDVVIWFYFYFELTANNMRPRFHTQYIYGRSRGGGGGAEEPDRRTADKITSCNIYYFQTHTPYTSSSLCLLPSSQPHVWIVRLFGECKMCESSFVGVIKPFLLFVYYRNKFIERRRRRRMSELG